MGDDRDAAVDPLLSPPRRFRAVEVEAVTRRPTGARHELEAASRTAAISQLLGLLGASAEQARVGPNGRIVQLGERAWLIVAVDGESGSAEVPPHLRRAGAKHRQTR